jgi:hypothetical protein
VIPTNVIVRINENLPSGPRLRRALALGLREGLEQVKARAEAQWDAEAPRSRDGSGLEVTVKATPSGIEASLGTPRFEARLLETGTKKKNYVIKPRRGRTRRRGPRVQRRKVLAFRAGGQTVFRREVVHPGLDPTFWLSRSVKDGLADLRQAVGNRLREAFRA